MRFALVALAATLVVAVAALPTYDAPRFSAEAAEHLFNDWMIAHKKSYSEEEAKMRFNIFHTHLEFVAKHNEEAANGLQTYTVALNQFAATSPEEFRELLGFHAELKESYEPVHLNGSIPASVDWRQKGAVTPVQNQGQCGSCWAFSATGALEGANFIKTGKLVQLSVQQLLDCDDKGQDQGCNGGLMDNAFDYVQQNGGIDSADDFKYLARRSFFFRCPASKSGKHVGTCSGHTDVPANDEQQLALAVSQQPVSVAIEADQPGFQLYASGVFSADCGTNLDHGVLAVGYGSDNGQDYWIVKNSWGASWGENGYIRMARNVAQTGGQCGIAMSASYPTA